MAAALNRAVRDGLPGQHHFYITFRTHDNGVEIPKYLMEKYPEEMTIVLQHQFFGLRVDEDGFTVMLSFNGKQERLRIPFSSVSTFADPSVNFALQFQPISNEDSEPPPQPPVQPPPNGNSPDKSDGTSPKESKVVSLDRFRKK